MEKQKFFWKGVRGITLFLKKKGFPRQGLGQSPSIPEKKVDFRDSLSIDLDDRALDLS